MSTRHIPYMSYPEADDFRSGCKVSWYYYKRKEDAEAAAKAARSNAIFQERLGYDFGYQSPGTIKLIDGCEGAWAKYNGLYEVCIP